MRRLIDAYGLREPILSLARGGAPLLGTCAGMILLADRMAAGDEPYFGLLDIEVHRNGYGRQLDSFEADLEAPSLGAGAPPRRLHPRAHRRPTWARGPRCSRVIPMDRRWRCARDACWRRPSIRSSRATGACTGCWWR